MPPPSEHHELQQKFDKKERECDAKTQEKEDMMQTLNKMKEKLEKESSEHKNVKQQVAELTNRLHQLSTVRPAHRRHLSANHRSPMSTQRRFRPIAVKRPVEVT